MQVKPKLSAWQKQNMKNMFFVIQVKLPFKKSEFYLKN